MKIFLQKTFLQILFLQKTFLQKTFLQRTFLPKLLLLAVLFLSGCSESIDMIYIVSGRTGEYSINGLTSTFAVSYDGYTYTDSDGNTLTYSSSSDSYVEFRGRSVDDAYTIVALTDIGEFNGTFYQYDNNTLTKKVGFYWKIYNHFDD